MLHAKCQHCDPRMQKALNSASKDCFKRSSEFDIPLVPLASIVLRIGFTLTPSTASKTEQDPYSGNRCGGTNASLHPVLECLLGACVSAGHPPQNYTKYKKASEFFIVKEVACFLET